MVKFILLFICMSQAGLAASPFFAFLSEDQKKQVWEGKQVDIFRATPDYAKLTSFVMIPKGADNMTPRKAAAIFWDLPGQVSYLDFGTFGLKEFKIGLGKGTSSVMSTATSLVLTAGGSVTQVYPQQNTVYRIDNGPGCTKDTYMITWNSTDPARPPFYSGMVSLTGMVVFELLPDNQNVLMVYQNIGILSAEGRQDETTANLLKGQGQFLATKHREHLESGVRVTRDQERALNDAVGCN